MVDSAANIRKLFDNPSFPLYLFYNIFGQIAETDQKDVQRDMKKARRCEPIIVYP